MNQVATHDIVVIGGSAGALEVLGPLVAMLPADFPAAIFIVLHTGATSHLAEILARAAHMPVKPAAGGDKIAPGHIYVAVPDRHLLLHDDHLLVRRGPRENHVRPAIDPLFRSAAVSFGSRVIGVVLSGMLNDGASGAMAIKECGGIVVVQDPADALYPAMPDSALQNARVDHCVPSGEIAPLLQRLVNEPAGPTLPIPSRISLESAIAAEEQIGMGVNDELGRPSRFACPECHGVLWQIDDPGMLRFRCHVGHAFTAEAILECEALQAEELLWSLMRNHQERAALHRELAEQARRRHQVPAAERHEARAKDYDDSTETFRRLTSGDVAAPRAV